MKTETIINRFRLWSINSQLVIFRNNEIDLIVKHFEKLKLSPDSYSDYFIDCVVDDIEVNMSDFMEQWNAGERPLDLQMF